MFGPPAEPARESHESRGGTSTADRTAVKSIRGAAAAAPRASASGSPLAAEAMNVRRTQIRTAPPAPSSLRKTCDPESELGSQLRVEGHSSKLFLPFVGIAIVAPLVDDRNKRSREHASRGNANDSPVQATEAVTKEATKLEHEVRSFLGPYCKILATDLVESARKVSATCSKPHAPRWGHDLSCRRRTTPWVFAFTVSGKCTYFSAGAVANNSGYLRITFITHPD